MSSPPSPSSTLNKNLDQDNPYNVQHFPDHHNPSLSHVRPFATSLTSNQTHDIADQLPSFQALTHDHQEHSHNHTDPAGEYDPYGQPVSIGSVENRRATSQPTMDGVYEGYGLPPSKTDIRPMGSSVTGTSTDDQNVGPRPYGQMISVTSKTIKKLTPPSYYTQQEYK
ncbi:hypothetical protein L1887_13625 [Cichorium endivia]|nr:hypothetical protein L1887_13625 [Cichorium endivia]